MCIHENIKRHTIENNSSMKSIYHSFVTTKNRKFSILKIRKLLLFVRVKKKRLKKKLKTSQKKNKNQYQRLFSRLSNRREILQTSIELYTIFFHLIIPFNPIVGRFKICLFQITFDRFQSSFYIIQHKHFWSEPNRCCC